MDFRFIFDERLKNIAKRDYMELQNLDPRVATKSVITLSGSIIEALLFDALVASGKWTFEEACQNNLKSMITVAHAKGIITEDRLSNATRNSRNLIHPGREIRDKVIFDETDAQAARLAVDILIREVQRWATSKREDEKIRTFLGNLTADQLAFLLLFSLEPAASDQYEHPRLKYEVYHSSRSLVENGILTKTSTDAGETQERVCLVQAAIEPVEDLIIKGKIQRDSILLDFGNIDASGAGGSGAPAGTW